MQDYYSVLGVERNATPDQIKKAYRSKAGKMHPDKGGDHEEFVTLQLAYDNLSDPDKRQHYDKYGNARVNPSLREQARAELSSLFLQVVQQTIAHGQFRGTVNIVGELKRHLHQTKAAQHGNRKNMLGASRNLRKVKTRLTAKDVNDTLFMDILRQQRLGIVQQYRAAKDAIKRLDLMLEMMENYSYEADPQAQSFYVRSGSTATTSTIF